MDYILMHKDIPVIRLDMDYNGEVEKVGNIENSDFLPLAVHKNVYDIKAWLRERAIPKTRSGIATVLEANKVKTTQSLLLKNLGVSLNDVYWLKPANSDYLWSDVNLYQNAFSASEVYSELGDDELETRLRLSPNPSLKGELRKKWFINESGIRIMAKGNYGLNCQQSLNEEFATLINKKQGTEIPFVEYTVRPYTFLDEEQAFCCFSNNFITSDKEEFVPAWEVCKIADGKNKSAYAHFVDNCVMLGMNKDTVEKFLGYQILLDYYITNTDRHLNNFGIIRDTETLKPLRMAPIYDCGNSMFWDQIYVKFNPKVIEKIETCSFLKKEVDLLRYVQDFLAFDISKVPSNDEFYNIYSKDKGIEPEKLEELIKCLQYKKERIERAQEKQKATIAGSGLPKEEKTENPDTSSDDWVGLD